MGIDSMSVWKSEVLELAPKYYSVSRLKSYGKCSKYYENQYILQLDKSSSFSASTLTGSLVHTALESYYRREYNSALEGFTSLCGSTLVELRVIKEMEANILVPMLIDYSKSIAELYFKASAGYNGKDKIRTRTGDIASNPTMTTAWKTLATNMGLDGSKAVIDEYISDKVEGLEFSLSDVFADAYDMCSKYSHPYELEDVLGVEIGISSWDKDSSTLVNGVTMPPEFGGNDGIYLNGYIDIVSRLGDDVLICDHKTSREAFTSIDVEHNVQLYTYVYAYEALTGVRPKYIGINNIRTSKLVLAEVPQDDGFIESILETLFRSHRGITCGEFHKHTPEPYSPCRSMYGGPCPFLGHCWPKVLDV